MRQWRPWVSWRGDLACRNRGAAAGVDVSGTRQERQGSASCERRRLWRTRRAVRPGQNHIVRNVPPLSGRNWVCEKPLHPPRPAATISSALSTHWQPGFPLHSRRLPRRSFSPAAPRRPPRVPADPTDPISCHPTRVRFRDSNADGRE